MLRKVRVVDAGDTDFLIGDRVDRVHFKMVNSLIKAEGKRVATAKPILMGLTQASLGTESFISAASFQETTRILSEAAISSSVDNLYGLKENVIVGKLIPAGTGIASFRKRIWVMIFLISSVKHSKKRCVNVKRCRNNKVNRRRVAQW